MYEYGGDELATELTRLFKELWAEGEVQQYFEGALIIHLYKNKGDRRRKHNTQSINARGRKEICRNNDSDHYIEAIIVYLRSSEE